MTRLTENNIKNINNYWPYFEKELYLKTKTNLLDLAINTLNLSPTIKNLISKCKVAIVPISSGEGIINGFSESLHSICKYLGFQSFITSKNNEGFLEAENKKTHLTISANDDFFLVKSVSDYTILSENRQATGQVFAEILRLMSNNNFSDGEIIILGCGNVGLAAAKYLNKYKQNLFFSDLNKSKSENFAKQFSGTAILAENLLNNWPQEIKYILDASTAEKFKINAKTNFFISAPGVPLAWPKKNNLWHDPLQSGTAVMLLEGLNKIKNII